MNQCETKMDEFLTSANKVLENIKEEQVTARKVINDTKKLINTVKTIFVLSLIAGIGWMMKVESGLATRPTYNEVITREQANTVHRLNVSNLEQNLSLTIDSPRLMEIVRANNDKYIRMVESVYKTN